MKPMMFLPLLVALLMTSTNVANCQEVNSRKVERIKRKIERQNQKLNELTGKESRVFYYSTSPIDKEDIQQIKREVLEAKDRIIKEHQHVMENFHREMTHVHRELSQKKLELRRQFVSPPHFRNEVYGWIGDQNILDVRKELEEETSSTDFPYEVSKEMTGMSLVINGAIDQGSVYIAIEKPDGTLFNEYTLSPLADVNLRQTIRFADQEPDSYVGKWVVKVVTEEASGGFSFQIKGR